MSDHDQDQEPFSALQKQLNRSLLDTDEVRSAGHWNELRTFLAVAKHRSFKKAAEALNLSHPTVGRQIKHLEQRLGTQLVISTGQGAKLTDQGDLLANHVARLDSAIHNIETQLKASSTSVAGRVRIAMTDALSSFWLVPSLRKLIANDRAIELKVQAPNNLLDFSENDADIFFSLNEQTQPHLICRPLGKLHFLPMASKEYLERTGIPSVNNLADHDFVNSLYVDERLQIWRQWGEMSELGKLRHYADTSLAHAMMVKSGYGIGLLASYALIDEGFIPIDLGFTRSFQIYITCREESLRIEHIRRVFEASSEVFSDVNPWFSRTLNLDIKEGDWDRAYRLAFNI